MAHLVTNTMSQDPEHQKLIQNGYVPSNRVQVPWRKSICDKVTYEKNAGLCERVGRGVGCFFGSLVCACSCASSFFDDTFGVAFIGVKEKVKYFKNEQADAEAYKKDVEVLGFDPRKTASLREFFALNKAKFKTHNGHYYYPYLRQSGLSSFIFVPFKNPENISSKSVYQNDGKSTGEPYGTIEEVMIQAVKFCSSYNKLARKGNLKGKVVTMSGTRDVYVVDDNRGLNDNNRGYQSSVRAPRPVVVTMGGESDPLIVTSE